MRAFVFLTSCLFLTCTLTGNDDVVAAAVGQPLTTFEFEEVVPDREPGTYNDSVELATGLCDTLNLICTSLSYSAITNDLDVYKESSTYEVTYEWHEQSYRELYNDYYERVIAFEKQVRDEDNPNVRTHYRYWIKLVEKADTVRYYVVNKRRAVWALDEEDGEYYWQDVFEDMFTGGTDLAFLEDFGRAFDCKLEPEQLFEEGPVFGTRCGFAGMPTFGSDTMKQAVLDENYDFIKEWLSSPVPEKQLYAVSALITLEQDMGWKMPDLWWEIVERVGTRDTDVYVCHGCIHSTSNMEEEYPVALEGLFME